MLETKRKKKLKVLSVEVTSTPQIPVAYFMSISNAGTKGQHLLLHEPSSLLWDWAERTEDTRSSMELVAVYAFGLFLGDVVNQVIPLAEEGHTAKDSTMDREAYSCCRWKGEITLISQITHQWASESNSLQSVLGSTNYSSTSQVRGFHGSDSSFK